MNNLDNDRRENSRNSLNSPVRMNGGLRSPRKTILTLHPALRHLVNSCWEGAWRGQASIPHHVASGQPSLCTHVLSRGR